MWSNFDHNLDKGSNTMNPSLASDLILVAQPKQPRSILQPNFGHKVIMGHNQRDQVHLAIDFFVEQQGLHNILMWNNLYGDLYSLWKL
jgi:hypothetical protein